jgi:hypothetical protein
MASKQTFSIHDVVLMVCVARGAHCKVRTKSGC